MVSKLEQSLFEVLDHTKQPALPELLKEDETKVWAEAIVLVKKTNASTNYAYAINNGFGKPDIARDFGDVCAIHSVTEIYPYKFLQPKYTPDLRSTEKVDEYLTVRYKNTDKADYIKELIESKDPEAKKAKKCLVNAAAIKEQIRLDGENKLQKDYYL